MINMTASTIADALEAVDLSRKAVYCSEEITVKSIMDHPWNICLKDSEGQLGIIAVLTILRPGVAEGWAVTTENLLKHPIAYTRQMHTIVREVFVQFRLHRLQIHVKCEASLVRWATALGFTIEGTLKSFGKNKEDYFIMGRTI